MGRVFKKESISPAMETKELLKELVREYLLTPIHNSEEYAGHTRLPSRCGLPSSVSKIHNQNQITGHHKVSKMNMKGIV